MSLIRFIHTADIHFGVENYGRIESATGIHTRLLDFRNALNFCIDKAIEEKVDFFLFCGDAYKTAHPSPTQQRMLFDCFLRLFNADIPLVIIVGNHDNAPSFGKAHALELFGQLPLPGFHVIAKPQLLRLETKSGPIQIVGLPWPSRTTIALNKTGVLEPHALARQIEEHIGVIIRELAEQQDPTIPGICAAHATISTALFSGSEKCAIGGIDPVILPSTIALEQFRYVALGHLHRHQQVNPGSTTPVVYSGSLERIDFGEINEEKGFCLVEVSPTAQTRYRFIKTPTRPLIHLKITLEHNERQNERIIEAIEKNDLAEAIVKISYELAEGVTDNVDLRAIQQACAQAHYLAGIFPVYRPPQRKTRTLIKVDMDPALALESYFKAQQMAQEEIDRLMGLVHELENEESEQQLEIKNKQIQSLPAVQTRLSP